MFIIKYDKITMIIIKCINNTYVFFLLFEYNEHLGAENKENEINDQIN